jgi:hypothetical protein
VIAHRAVDRRQELVHSTVRDPTDDDPFQSRIPAPQRAPQSGKVWLAGAGGSALKVGVVRADISGVTDLLVTRWRRYGKDRLYVSTGAGERVGWADVVTSQRTLELSSYAAEFDAAIDAHLSAPSMVEHIAKPAIAGAPSAPAHRGRVWVDLAQNRPGQAAREQAVAHRDAMRERSKIGTVVARTFDVKNDERAWRVGADGEELVGASLVELEKHDWRILHAVPVGTNDSDIDHVAIGPGGVYTLNTKTHRGHRVTVYERAILVDGHKQPYLRNSLHEGERAGRLLTSVCGFPVIATPLIVVLCDELRVKQQPSGVYVVGRRDIASWLRKRPIVLDSAQIGLIYEQARRSTTWQPVRNGSANKS